MVPQGVMCYVFAAHFDGELDIEEVTVHCPRITKTYKRMILNESGLIADT